ncbi:MAG: hypothetical protein RRC34_06270 [Lentisphaeria bacterium]|nr:hypothetical protein [Lentisphaeria bacterium]
MMLTKTYFTRAFAALAVVGVVGLGGIRVSAEENELSLDALSLEMGLD